MSLTVVILVLVTLERVAELPVAARNTAKLRARGAFEVAPGHYPAIVLLHATWLAALWWWAPGQPVNLTLLGLFGLVEIARVWVLWTLGRRWTTRIIVLPGEELVRRGPYRFVDHPNYWIVVAEIALLPMVFGLWSIAIPFSALNAVALAVRIRAENEALGRA
jgi:methyltransferase